LYSSYFKKKFFFFKTYITEANQGQIPILVQKRITYALKFPKITLSQNILVCKKLHGKTAGRVKKHNDLTSTDFCKIIYLALRIFANPKCLPVDTPYKNTYR